MGENLLIMVVLIGGAATIPFLARKFSMPSAILEIIFGTVIFNAFFAVKPEWFIFLKEIGLIYLMFIAGMELDIRALLGQKRFWWYLIMPVSAFAIMPLVFMNMGYSYYLGIVVSVMSAGIIIPVLKETGLMRTPLGRDILGISLTGELVSIVVITGVFVYQHHGFSWMAALNVLKLIVFLLLAFLFIKLLYLLAWWNPVKVQKVMESKDPVEEGIRAVIFVAFAGALLAYGAGIEPILGAFMGGFVFSFVFKSKGRFEDKINAVGFGFFIPFFFMGVGADFDARFLMSPTHVLFALFLSVMVLAGNMHPLLFSPLMKTGRLEAFSTSLLLSAPLTMMIVAGGLGVKLGLVSGETNDSIVLAAMISGVVYPFAFRPLGKKISDRLSTSGK